VIKWHISKFVTFSLTRFGVNANDMASIFQFSACQFSDAVHSQAAALFPLHSCSKCYNPSIMYIVYSITHRLRERLSS